MATIITFSVSDTKPSGTLLSPPTHAHLSSRSRQQQRDREHRDHRPVRRLARFAHRETEVAPQVVVATDAAPVDENLRRGLHMRSALKASVCLRVFSHRSSTW
jgi:hypothetical protein